MTMATPPERKTVNQVLRVLIIEDSEADARLLLRQLTQGGFELESQRVESAAALTAALAAQEWDVIIADYRLTQFTGHEALKLVQATGLDLPFILVSGVIGEEQAAAVMKAGAHDFLLKDRLAQLAPAVKRELTDAGNRRQLKHANAALLESEERFHTMVNAMPQLAWIARHDGHIFWYNQRWYEYSGTTPEQMEGWGWQSVHDPVELPKVLERWKASIATGEAFEMTFPLRGADGSFRSFLTRVFPMRNAEGRVLQWFGTNTDVNELKHTEQQLRASLKEVHDLRTALDEHAIVAMTDPHGRITFVNDKFCTISKYSRKELMGQDHRIINSGHHPAEFFRDLWKTISHGRVWQGEIKNRAKDGSFYWVATTIVPFLNEQGKVLHHVAIRADITERKRAEEVNAQLAAIVESSRDAIIGKDPGGIVTSWNKGAEEIFGYSASEMIGHSIMRLIPQDIEEEEATIIGRIVHGESMRQYETVRVRKDGSALRVSVTLSPIKDPAGRVIGVSKVARDITAIKLIENQILDLNHELESRVVERTFELQTAVRSLGEEIAERRRLEREVLKISEREQTRIGRDLHDGVCQSIAAAAILLDFEVNNLERNKSPAVPRLKKIAQLLRESVDQTRQIATSFVPAKIEQDGLESALHELASIASSGGRGECNFIMHPPIEISDQNTAIHLFRIAQEALNNAIRHGQAHNVTIELAVDDGRVSLSIRDDGTGILRKPITSGLGLHTMEYRAKAIGGTLEISSEAGRGTTVICSFPVKG